MTISNIFHKTWANFSQKLEKANVILASMASMVGWQDYFASFDDQDSHQTSTQKYSNIVSIIFKILTRGSWYYV